MTGLKAALTAWVENVRDSIPPPRIVTETNKATNQAEQQKEDK